MGKGNDPNCITTISAGGAGGFIPETPEQQSAMKAGEKLGLIEYRLTAGARKSHRRAINDGGDVLERAIDSFSVLAEYERTVVEVSLHHPDPRMRERAHTLVNLCNQKMVRKAALGWFQSYKSYGFRLDDIIAEGQIGLAEANETLANKTARLHRDAEAAGKDPQTAVTDKDLKVYDPTLDKGRGTASFMTYGLPKVNMRIRRYIENNSERVYGARIPTEPFHEVVKVSHVIKKLQAADSRAQVTPEAVLAHPDMVDHKPYQGLADADKLARVQATMEMSQMRGKSLNERLRGSAGGEEGDAEMGDMLRDERPSAAREAESAMVLDSLRQIMDEALDADERLLVGCLDMDGMLEGFEPAETNAEMAERLSMSIDRVRARRNSGMKKLRAAMLDQGLAPAGAAA